MIAWPRGTLAQFGVILAASVGMGLVLFVVLGFQRGWQFPVDPYRARYFYDGSSVHTTGLKCAESVTSTRMAARISR